MKKLFLSLLALAALSSGHIMAQQTKLLTAEKHNEYGLVYTLPSTAFEIQVVAVKEIKKAGDFSKYSKIFTADKDAIQEDSKTWTIETVRVTPYGVPNLENIYLMQLKAGATTFIEVGEDGMLLSINKEVEMPSREVLEIVEKEGDEISGKEYLEFVNEDFIAAQSSLKKAQLLAEELMEIRDAKISLTRGTAETMPTDGKQLEIMLRSLEKQEKALMNAFTGASWKERIVRTFTYIPNADEETVICRLNSKEGIVESDDSGIPLIVSLQNIIEAELPIDAKGEEKKLPKDAVVYCLPGNAELSMTFDKNIMYKKNFQMSQFGIIFGLNPSLFTDKKEPSFAEFDPATGALVKLATIKQ